MYIVYVSLRCSLNTMGIELIYMYMVDILLISHELY